MKWRAFQAGIGQRGAAVRATWQSGFDTYKAENAEATSELDHLEWSSSRELGRRYSYFEADEKGMATRVSSGKVLNSLAEKFPYARRKCRPCTFQYDQP